MMLTTLKRCTVCKRTKKKLKAGSAISKLQCLNCKVIMYELTSGALFGNVYGIIHLLNKHFVECHFSLNKQHYTWGTRCIKTLTVCLPLTTGDPQ